MAALVLGAPTPEDSTPAGADVFVSFEVPARATAVFTDGLAAYAAEKASAAARASAGGHGGAAPLLYVTQTQMSRDVEGSANSGAWRGGVSAALVCALLFVALTRSRSRHPLRLTLATLLAMVAVLCVGTALCTLVDVPSSAFSVVVAPMVLGMGVDAMLVLLTACNEPARGPDVDEALRRCAPSLLASTLTTCSGFGFGALVPIPNIRALCAQACVLTAVCGAAQLTLFPSLVKLTRLRRSPRECRVPSRPLVAVAALALLAVPLAVGRPNPPLEFDITKQLRADTTTARAVRALYANFGAAPMLTYALVRSPDVDWAAVEGELEALPRSEVVSWHRVYNASGAVDVDAWLRGNPAMRTLFRDVIDRQTGESVVLARTSFDVDMSVWEKHDVALRLHGMDARLGVCAFNSDMLGGYTIVRLLRVTGALVGATCAVCLVVGVWLVGARALLAVPTLALSYMALHALVRLAGVPADMIVLVALLVTPGILTDYVLHLAHDPRNAAAVVFSAGTSAASLLPLANFPVESVRSFALVYVTILVAGGALTLAVVRTAQTLGRGWDGE